MAKYTIKVELVIHAPVKIVVEADSKQAAEEQAWNCMPINLHDALRPNADQKWGAAITLKPPKGIEVVSRETRAITVQGAG